MVASIAVARNQNYLIKDYYHKDQEKEGVWIGTGSSIFGLTGEIDQKDFGNLWHGYAPESYSPQNGNRALVQNAGSESRRAGHDITFSAPKGVSVIWGIADPRLRAQIENAHHQAVMDANQYLEEQAAYTRRGKGGAVHEKTAGLVAASFQHGNSRANDMQLHTHCLYFNVAPRMDGGTGAIESSYLYDAKMGAGAVFQARSATEMQRLGFEIKVDEKTGTYDIVGITDEAKVFFSKRSIQIRESLEHDNLSATSKNKEKAGLKTRTVKTKETEQRLQTDWRKDAAQFGITPSSIREMQKEPLQELSVFQKQKVKKNVLSSALAECTKMNTVFTQRDLDLQIARSSIGEGLTYQDGRAIREEFFKSNNSIELQQEKDRLHGNARDRLFTTKEQINLEAELLNRVENKASENLHPVDSKALFESLSERPSLTTEQRKAIKHITSPKGIAVVSGMAGTGKTFMLSAAKDTWEKSGYKVKGFALSGKAASGLHEGAGIESRTLDSLYYAIDKRQKEGKDSDHKMAGGDSSRWAPLLNEKTICVVDEAAMVDNPRMYRLFKEAEKHNSKVILLGDNRQLQPVEQGGAFKTISDHVGEKKLTNIIRQQEPWQREAVHNFADSKAELGLAAYEKRGFVTINKDKDKLKSELIDNWAKSGGITRPEENPIIAVSNSDVDALNALAQKKRLDAGVLGKRSGIIGGVKMFEQDRIEFLQNNKKLGIHNGQGGVLKKIDLIKDKVSVALDNDSTVSFSSNEYDRLKLNYARTTHKAQGITAENTHILAGSSMQNRELSYVQMSRHKKNAQIYVQGSDRKEAIDSLAKRMNQQNEKTLASRWKMAEKQNNNAVAHTGQMVRYKQISR